jgi:molybdopterin synthase catalytic subunit
LTIVDRTRNRIWYPSLAADLSRLIVTVRLTHTPIDATAVMDAVRSHQAGAVVLFLGTVREFTQGRQTTRLFYEAFSEMALREMRQLEEVARQRWPIVESMIEHRLGPLELGEIAVAVAVSSPHRQTAFEAGQFLIDELKRVVPIWKQEHGPTGITEWVHPNGSTSSLAPDPSVTADHLANEPHPVLSDPQTTAAALSSPPAGPHRGTAP